MAIVHSYDMTAHAGKDQDLGNALKALAEAVKHIAGSQGAMVLQDSAEPHHFVFLEFWEDEASRKAAGSQLPKDVMGQIMASVGGPLKMADFARIAG